MKPRVALISKPTVDWPTFTLVSQEILGRSPTRACDSMGVQVGDINSYLLSLIELYNPGVDPFKLLKSEWKTLQHVAISFLVHSDIHTLIKLLTQEDLNVLPVTTNTFQTEYLTVVSGSLDKLKVAIIRSSNEVDFNIRYLSNLMYLCLQKEGLCEVFKEFTRSERKDGTFSLER